MIDRTRSIVRSIYDEGKKMEQVESRLGNIGPRFERSSCRSINSFVSRHGIEYQGRKEGKEGKQRGNPILLQICYVAAAVLPAHCRALQSSSFAIALGHVSAPLRSLIMRACPSSSSLSGIRRWYAPIASSPANLCTEHCLGIPPNGVRCEGIFRAPYFSLQTYYSRKQVCVRCIRVGLKHEQRVFNAYL